MTPKSPFAAPMSRYALASLLIFGLFSGVPARADGITEGVFNFLGLTPDDNTNKYPERAPLVVPPTTKLPKPKSTAAPNDPNWIKDPELAKKKTEDNEPYVPGTAFADFINQNFAPKDTKQALTDPPKDLKQKAKITPEIEAATKAATGQPDKPWYKFWE
jgi:hypothetical protein